MQDRFKFRIWEKVSKHMHYNDFLITATGYIAALKPLLHPDNTPYKDEFVFNQRELDFDKDNVLMQCTGLQDKNGKLIYEGDILFYKIGSIKCREVVKWSPERCGWIKGYQDLSTYKKYHEVLGNIYENPELIKDFKNE